MTPIDLLAAACRLDGALSAIVAAHVDAPVLPLPRPDRRHTPGRRQTDRVWLPPAEERTGSHSAVEVAHG